MRLPENSEKLTASHRYSTYNTRVDGVVYFSIRAVRAQTHKTQKRDAQHELGSIFDTQASNMVTYNTVPLSEARLNEPKAPQNSKAMIALVRSK